MRISDWSSDVCSSDLLTALWKVMPALVAGNTVVLRPSPLTPLSAMLFADAANEAELPAGVLNIVLEAGIEGGRLLSTRTEERREGKRVSVSVRFGGRRNNTKKTQTHKQK